jgi:hypothetical protein
MIDHMVAEGFLKAPYREMVLIDDDIDRLINRLQRYEPPVCKWVEEEPIE